MSKVCLMFLKKKLLQFLQKIGMFSLERILEWHIPLLCYIVKDYGNLQNGKLFLGAKNNYKQRPIPSVIPPRKLDEIKGNPQITYHSYHDASRFYFEFNGGFKKANLFANASYCS